MAMLHFPGFDTIEQIEELRHMLQSLKFFDPESAVSRFREIKALLDFSWKNASEPSKQVPMKFFINGLRVYVLGFDEATIYYSSLSIELMLLNAAIRKRGIEVLVEANKNRKLNFRWLIDDGEVLEKQDVSIAHDIRRMRDSYVHFQNHLMYSEVGKPIDRRLFSDVPENEIMEVERVDRILSEEIQRAFPYAEALVSRSHIEFIKSRRRVAAEKIRPKMMTALSKGPEGLRTLLGETETPQKVDALDILMWSKHLRDNPRYYLGKN